LSPCGRGNHLRRALFLVATFAALLALSTYGACGLLKIGRQPFSIAWTYDTSGYLETCGCSAHQLGGLARRATELGKLREKQPVLAIEGPHIMEDGGEFQLFKGETIVQALDLMGYKALVIGIREAQQGRDGLSQLVKDARFPCVCANLALDGKAWPTATAVLSCAGSRVGLTAVSQPESVSFKLPAGVSFCDPEEALKAILPELRRNTDMVVISLEGEETWIEGMCFKFAGANTLFLTGNRADTTATLEFTGDPPRLNNWKLGKYLGVVAVDPSQRGYSFSGTTIPLEDSMDQDKAVQQLLDDTYKPQLKERFFSTAKQDLSQVYLPADYCKDCHAEQYKKFAGSGHARSLDSLTKTGQVYDPDCMKCHVVYDTHTDELMPMNCVTCHTNITDKHVYDALDNKVKPPAKPVISYTYQSCARCHDALNSVAFMDYWPQYANKIYHGGDIQAAQEAAKQMGLDIKAGPPRDVGEETAQQ